MNELELKLVTSKAALSLIKGKTTPKVESVKI